MVGTMKKNKPELPAGRKDRAPLSSKFAFTDTTTVVSYCPKKRRNVILMSTLHKDAAVSSGSDKKPTIILDYNKNKEGVDNLDKLTATYTCQRMTRRWPMVVFYNMLDVSASAELTYHSDHIISNTKSILAGILLSQPCLSTNQTSHSRNPIQAT
ncbi:hypothetical protein D5F01_LYC21787 [Larimichthys crocea]|uniref:PiggyBac transposable element-derived protein domain-containing protein n=1 Tax=Larimichthys crocea TaxID=215358 RepID=A0A6G0HK89_LARCR|nr:hypothetical protein D5F01_LYC21787 [Larimichthys crocea]